jgi:hypothetical protein
MFTAVMLQDKITAEIPDIPEAVGIPKSTQATKTPELPGNLEHAKDDDIQP